MLKENRLTRSEVIVDGRDNAVDVRFLAKKIKVWETDRPLRSRL